MKNIITHTFRMLLALFCLSLWGGCSEDEATEGIRLAGDMPTNQMVYADETRIEDGTVEFVTEGAWTAQVREVSVTKAGGEEISWISLSQYSGDKAGKYAIQISLSKNFTGSDRKACIDITSGSTLTFTIEQKGTTEEGEIPVDIPETNDGNAPYVSFDTTEISLPAFSPITIMIDFKTNMIEPVVRIDLPESDEPAEPIAAIVHITEPNMEGGNVCQLELEVYPNRTGNSRVAELKFLTRDENLVQSVLLKQEAGAVCQLLSKHSEVGSLSFEFKANAQTRRVDYGLSDRPLSSDEAINEFLSDGSKSKKRELGEGEKTFKLTFDNLIPATSYYLYLCPSSESASGAMMMEEATTSAQESKHDLILEVSANPANEFTVYLPFCDDYLDGTIDWGDGTVEKAKGWNPQGASHTYTVKTTSTYLVKFSGALTQLYLIADIRPARENTLLSIKQWGYTGLKKIDLGGFSSLKEVAPDKEGAFRNIDHFGIEPYGGSFTGTGIEVIPTGFFKYATRATSFDYTFGDCEQLVSIPEDLFENCKEATSFRRTFISCKKISRIPENLFASCNKAGSFWATFADCESLEAIPENLFAHNPEVISFEGTFSNCNRLKSIPAKLFANCPKVRYLGTTKFRDDTFRGGSGVFQGCKSVQSIPEELFAANPLVEDFSYAFADCESLGSLPQNLFKCASKLKYMEYAFLNCKLLKAIPAVLFEHNRQLASVEGLFAQCYHIEGESPYSLINGKKVHLYEREKYNTEFVAINAYARCFNGCTKLNDYNDFPDTWK